MNVLKGAVLTLLLSPAMTMASEAPAPDLIVLPGILTPAGQKFAGKCSDTAFAKATDPAARRNRCERLLAQWRLEAARRTDALADRDNSKPGFLSLRALPRYPSL